VAKWGNLMTQYKNEVGAIITAENGKPFPEGVGEALYSASFCDWASHECRRVNGQTMSRNGFNDFLKYIYVQME